MAREFDGVTQQLNSMNGLLSLPDAPCTLSIWFWPDRDTHRERLINIGDSVLGDAILLDVRGDVGGDPIRAAYFTVATAQTSVDSSNSINTGQWNHVAGVYVLNSDVWVYLNGTGTQDTDGTPATGSITSDFVQFGRSASTTSWPFDGKLAEAACWNIALTSTEIGLLNFGVSPLAVRPESLVGYWPLLGRGNIELDLVGIADLSLADDLSLSRPTAYTHPPVWYPNGAWATPWTTEAPPSEGITALEINHSLGNLAAWKRGVRIYTP
jgi:hypothetical protein